MKKFKIEYLIYIFIVISPILDALANIFRNIFPSAPISPSTIIRPIIPLILLVYIFFKDKKVRLPLFLSGIVFISYGLFHLLTYNSFKTGISFGSVFQEAQYVINYIYMIYVLFIIIYLNKHVGLPKLNKYLLIMLIEYMLIIYFSIITGTSYPTYVEGIGYRSYFVSGNSIGTILIILYASILGYVLKNKSKIGLTTILAMAIYLMFLLGTRTGLFGVILVTGLYIFVEFLFNFKNIIKNKWFKISIPFLVLMVGFVFVFGSSTLERRKLIREEASNIIDINTNMPGHTTGDTAYFVYRIRRNDVSNEFMSGAEKESYLDLYRYANKHKILANDNRKQQLIYNMFLVKNQGSIKGILFGNGYLNNYGALTLEMEIPAILLNFGIVGFILFLSPILGIVFIFIKKVGMNEKKLNKENAFSFITVLLGLTLSCLAGYVLFSSSCVLLIIINLSRLMED